MMGKDRVVEIESVDCKELTSNNNGKVKKDKRPIIRFKGAEKTFVCNKTNGKAIAGMYGVKTEEWKGKKITIYASTTLAGGETVDCIRVRPTQPKDDK